MAIQYSLRSNRRIKRLRLTVEGDGSLVVSKPLWVTKKMTEDFVHSKESWILRSQKKIQDRSNPGIPWQDRGHYEKYKERARQLVLSRLEKYNSLYGYKYHRVSIKNQKTRWGSCSKDGNLNFNYKILFLDQDLADYIIVHELCHLRELNHSTRFWGLVAKTRPNYLELRRKLKQKGLGLD